MLEYFTAKKFKKSREAKKQKEEEAPAKAESSRQHEPQPQLQNIDQDKRDITSPTEDSKVSDTDSPTATPVLDKDDESFIARLLEEDGPAPPLPPRVKTPELEWASDDAASSKESDKEDDDPKGKKKDKAKGDGRKQNRLSLLFTRHKKHGDTLTVEDATTPQATEAEEEKEEADISRVLDRLNLTAKNNKVVPLSEESAELLQKFTQIFKDLANGVPTAYDDLVGLIKDRDGAITRGFEKLPSSLQKLVTQLPEKLTASIAPEVLAAAAKSQGIDVAKGVGMKEAVEKMMLPQNLFELATKPGALVGMLRAIVTALKTRWPAFLGVNVLWSVALFLLMFVLWYCHKRGREVRLEREKSEAEAAAAMDAGDRIEELPDDPALPESGAVQESETGRALEASPQPALLEPPPPTADLFPKKQEKDTADVLVGAGPSK